MSENPAPIVSYSIVLTLDMSSETILTDAVTTYKALQKRLKKEGINAPITFGLNVKGGKINLESGESVARAPMIATNGGANNGGPCVAAWQAKYGVNFRCSSAMQAQFGLSGTREEMCEKLSRMIDEKKVIRTATLPVKYYLASEGIGSATVGQGEQQGGEDEALEIDVEQCV